MLKQLNFHFNLEPGMGQLPIEADDFGFEEALLRDGAYQPKNWLRYIEHKRKWVLERGDPANLDRILSNIYERAIQAIPASYKMWKSYLDFKRARLQEKLSSGGSSTDGIIQECALLNNAYERALVFLLKMPRIWLDYATFLFQQRRIVKTRRVIDDALRALPFSQHERIWEVFLRLASSVENISPETSLHIWKRYWQICAKSDQNMQTYCALLERHSRYNDAAGLLASALKHHKGHEDAVNYEALWERICSLVINHGEDIEEEMVERVLSTAITLATEKSTYSALQGGNRKEVKGIFSAGRLWAAKAMYHVKLAHFEDARQVFEEALGRVPTIRDFGLVFDAYAKFEESLLTIELERRLQDSDVDRSGVTVSDDLEFRLARLEHLLARRKMLLCSVRISQQPHKVDAWLARITITDPIRRPEAYREALAAINPRRAKGSLAKLWTAFAKHHEDSGDVEEAKKVFAMGVDKDCNYGLDSDELAALWIEYAEFQRRHGTVAEALDLIYQATRTGSLERSTKLWNYAVDLEESRGLVGAVSSAYDEMIRLGVANLQNVINYALFLESQNLTERAFKVFERGIAVFGWPAAFELWNLYLPRAIDFWIDKAERRMVEQVRDLFEQAVHGCPQKYAKAMYLRFSQFEQDHGLVKSSLRILERAVDAVPAEERIEIYELLLVKAEQSQGILATRPIYESALAKLPLVDALLMAQRYAGMEARLGEFNRARAIYGHAATLADPRIAKALWEGWHEFEITHGNEDTFRELLRIKRSVAARFAHLVPSFVPETAANVGNSEEIVL